MKNIRLKKMKKAIEEGKKLQLIYSGPYNFPIEHDCLVCELEEQINSEFFSYLFSPSDNVYYGYINNIIGDKKALISLLKISCNYALNIEKSNNNINSSLVLRKYTDPMDMMVDYYNISFLNTEGATLEESLINLNQKILNFGIYKEIEQTLKCVYPNTEFENNFCFELNEKEKTLKLTRRKFHFK